MLATMAADAQNLKDDFKATCDSVVLHLKERMTTVTSLKLRLETVTKRGNDIDFYFNDALSDYNWSEDDIRWLREEIGMFMPSAYSKYGIGNIYAKKVDVNTLATPKLTNDGNPAKYKEKTADPRGKVKMMVSRHGAPLYNKGLSGRYIALWQSHGRYFEASTDRWEWQRAPLNRTVEDVYTQSYVLPFLIPMLENAGAYVMTPRERDTQKYEVIIDNDEAFSGHREGLTRRKGHYHERGKWNDAGVGFADAKRVYVDNDNPFTMGSVRSTSAVSEEEGQKAEAKWSFEVPESGEYAVYISYKSLPNSCESAHYTVTYSSGKAEFSVNQRIGGGTWIYLGTFHFDSKTEASVMLDNVVADAQKGKLITADGVKIGGGMGKISRGLEGTDKSTWTTSGLPCYLEGALYWEQFAGVDTTVFRKWEGDYTQDYASRGAWVSQLTGGSHVNPKYDGVNGRGIPIDLSFGFHSDAGSTPNDSIVGTLSIYTLLADNKSTLPNGRSRQLGRHLAGVVQDQLVQDIRADFNPRWTRRELWNKNYSESRTTSVPGMLLELLSHQNFADMKYGLDPSFRFTVSRAVYKGILKFLSDEYGCPYVVQPLPVNSISATITSGNEVKISWKDTPDPLEPTATAKNFILYTRVGEGQFNEGIKVDVRKDGAFWYTNVSIDPNELYSFRIVAENEGGVSFPSETVCAAISSTARGNAFIVNNFDRVSAPTWIDYPDYAGFDGATDAGVGYINEINFIGENYEFRRHKAWTDDDEAGFTASYTDMAGTIVPGNTFDFISVHARAMLAAGWSISSASRDAYIAKGDNGAKVIDIICGKQVTTKIGAGNVPARYEVFPTGLQTAIKTSTAAGRSIMISGAYIGTDAWDEVYPVEIDSKKRSDTQKFIAETLGYKWVTNHACRNGIVEPVSSADGVLMGLSKLSFHQELNSDVYKVETPDGIKPANEKGSIALRYSGNGIPASVAFNGGKYRVLSFGFPLETLCSEEELNAVMSQSLAYLNR